MNKKIMIAVAGIAMGMGMSITATASSGLTNGCNWKSWGSLENYCGYQYFLCTRGPGSNQQARCRNVKQDCIKACGK